MDDKITFSFGENWSNFLETIDKIAVEASVNDLQSLFNKDATGDSSDFVFQDKTVLDIGCGSGLHSYAFYLLGAKSIFSFDYDIKSVEATKVLWEGAGKPSNWTIVQGSILDEDFLHKLPKSDIVYSWGVLHHTGEMWNAVENSRRLLKGKGSYWLIGLYQGVKTYKRDLALKKRYNRASKPFKKIMELGQILKMMIYLIRKGKNPLKWNQKRARGMTVYYDIIDWLGGLPYEVASAEQVIDFANSKGNLNLIKMDKTNEAVRVYLFVQT